MENKTIDALNSVFTMGDIEVPNEGKFWTVFICSVIYLFSVICNLLLLFVIAVNRSLHGPMYMFLVNLIINDLIGVTAMLPRVMSDVLSDYRYTSYPACFIQAFFLHIYGGATHFILSVMAFDRYVAICYPLRYHTIMTKVTVVNLIVFVWLADFLLISGLFGLMLRFPLCKTVLTNFFCDNVTLLRITCATDTSINSIYGLLITGVFNGIGVFSIVFSYSWIIYTCFKNKDSSAKLKAANTCGTHLLVFLIYEITAIVIILARRFPSISPLFQNFMGMMFVIVPPSFNSVIYGIKSKEIKVKLKHLFQFTDTDCLKVKVNTVTK